MNALPQFDGNVQKLLAIATLTPLSEFPFVLRPLTTHLRSIGHGWCLLTGIRSLRDGVPDHVLRACMIVLASNVAAAVLVSRCEDSFVRGNWETTELPPIEYFVPSSTGWTYGEILTAGRGTLMECAVYGSDGEFLFKELRLKRSKLHFQSRTRRRTELPFAISLF